MWSPNQLVYAQHQQLSQMSNQQESLKQELESVKQKLLEGAAATKNTTASSTSTKQPPPDPEPEVALSHKLQKATLFEEREGEVC